MMKRKGRKALHTFAGFSGARRAWFHSEYAKKSSATNTSVTASIVPTCTSKRL